jgi:hypothetical protein
MSDGKAKGGGRKAKGEQQKERRGIECAASFGNFGFFCAPEWALSNSPVASAPGTKRGKRHEEVRIRDRWCGVGRVSGGV